MTATPPSCDDMEHYEMDALRSDLSGDLDRVKDERDRLRAAARRVLAVLDQQSVVVREAECIAVLRTALGEQR